MLFSALSAHISKSQNGKGLVFLPGGHGDLYPVVPCRLLVEEDSGVAVGPARLSGIQNPLLVPVDGHHRLAKAVVTGVLEFQHQPKQL